MFRFDVDGVEGCRIHILIWLSAVVSVCVMMH